MGKRWTEDEDSFLLTYCGIGADFIASHDLGRPDGAGGRRLSKLISTGAAEHFAIAMKNLGIYRQKAGHIQGRISDEINESSIEDWVNKSIEWENQRIRMNERRGGED